MTNLTVYRAELVGLQVEPSGSVQIRTDRSTVTLDPDVVALLVSSLTPRMHIVRKEA